MYIIDLHIQKFWFSSKLLVYQRVPFKKIEQIKCWWKVWYPGYPQVPWNTARNRSPRHWLLRWHLRRSVDRSQWGRAHYGGWRCCRGFLGSSCPCKSRKMFHVLEGISRLLGGVHNNKYGYLKKQWRIEIEQRLNRNSMAMPWDLLDQFYHM